MFVLVHGAWHGKWCWELLEPHLEMSGAPSVAVDLPGRAGDLRSVWDLTLDSYVDRVVEAIDSCSEPVVLVGHSLGGLVISQTAERVPEKISSLVYLCAMLLNDGESTFDVFSSDGDSQILNSVEHDDAFSASSLNPDAVHDLLYGDCTIEVSEKAGRRLVPEPLIPASTPVHVTPERWGRVSRSYILCTEDRAISPAKQQSMIDSVGVDSVVEINSSHSPFMSQPDRLAAALISLAE